MKADKNIDIIETGDIRIDKIMPELFSKWIQLTFENCLDETGDYVKLKQKNTKSTGKYPVVDQGEDLINGYVDDENLLYTGELPVIIFGDHTRRVKFVDFPFAVGADGTKIFKPQAFLNERFFNYYLNTLTIASEGYSRHYKFLKAINVPIPPLAEQNRIVTKLDAILARVNNNKARLEKIPALLKNFRQSVLAAAVSGELTKEWREENETAKVENIIQKIQRKRLEDAKSESKKNDIKEIYDFIEEGNHFELPNEWRFISLDKLCDGFQYGSSQKSDSEGLVPVLRMGNLQNGKIDWSDLKYSSDKDEIKKYLLDKNDILFNRTNSPELVGKTSIFKGEQKAIFAGYLIRVKYLPDIHPDYLNYCLNTPYAKEWCQFAKTDGVSQSNINAQKLAKFEMPYCSLEEQQEIVRKVEELFHFADSIEARYQKAKAWFDKLPQSILAKAFRGELVPQDENDEPASVLLERIRESMKQQAELEKIIKKNRASKKKSMKSKTDIDLNKELKSRFKKSKFKFEDVKDFFSGGNYDELKTEFFKSIKEKLIEMSYNSKEKKMYFKFK